MVDFFLSFFMGSSSEYTVPLIDPSGNVWEVVDLVVLSHQAKWLVVVMLNRSQQ